MNMSHPTRVRGLKYETQLDGDKVSAVAPYTGAWIEIERSKQWVLILHRRTLHGCVD